MVAGVCSSPCLRCHAHVLLNANAAASHVLNANATTCAACERHAQAVCREKGVDITRVYGSELAALMGVVFRKMADDKVS